REHRRIDHRRKYSKQPYDVHLKAVAELVAAVTDDPEMIAAAWLHDVVEDTPVTLDDVEKEFGAAVARLVDGLTDVSRPGDGHRPRPSRGRLAAGEDGQARRSHRQRARHLPARCRVRARVSGRDAGAARGPRRGRREIDGQGARHPRALARAGRIAGKGWPG